MTIGELFSDPAYAVYMICACLFIPMFLFSLIISLRVNSVFNKYNREPCSSGISAQTYARNFLIANGINDVAFRREHGSLTDNFNPKTNTISLSDTVRNSSAVGAIGVACHECGHAIQHARNYVFSSIRLKLVPVCNIANRLMWPIFIIGYIFGFASPYTSVGRIFIYIGLTVMGLSLLFALVTLPTEFNASKRAYKYLKTCLLPEEAVGVRKVLSAAAMTYVASFMMFALQFIYLLALLLMGRRRK